MLVQMPLDQFRSLWARPLWIGPLRPLHRGRDFAHLSYFGFLKVAGPVETDPLRPPSRGWDFWSIKPTRSPNL